MPSSQFRMRDFDAHVANALPTRKFAGGFSESKAAVRMRLARNRDRARAGLPHFPDPIDAVPSDTATFPSLETIARRAAAIQAEYYAKMGCTPDPRDA